jgi:hypothetical protein
VKDFAAAESTGGGLKLIIARVRLRHIQIHQAQSLRERKRFALKAAPLLWILNPSTRRCPRSNLQNVHAAGWFKYRTVFECRAAHFFTLWKHSTDAASAQIFFSLPKNHWVKNTHFCNKYSEMRLVVCVAQFLSHWLLFPL